MAAVDYFLKIDGVTGESMDSKHSNEVDIHAWSWGETNSGSHAYGGGGGAGKVSMQDFSFTMKTNKASVPLFLACANGTVYKTVVLTCRKAGKQQQEYLTITFSEALISSFQIGGSTGDVVPTDQISLNFSKIELSYAPQKQDGTLDAPIKHNWSLKTNTGA